MEDKKKITWTFHDAEQVPAESPDASHLPSRFDADPGISAEIAVERGEATPEEQAFYDELQADHPLMVETGDKIEVETNHAPGKAVSHFVDGEAPLLSNPDGSVTRLDSTSSARRSVFGSVF